MVKKNFLLLSLDESKINTIANVVSNKSCKKILDYLAEHDATETDLSKELGIPLSTVHYNLKQLEKSGLVEAGEYHYSEKGREVYHYTLANKYIIITPKKTTGIIGKLKEILPSIALLGGFGIGIQYFFSSWGSKDQTMVQQAVIARSAVDSSDDFEAIPEAAARLQEDEVRDIVAQAPSTVEPSVQLFNAYPGLWFFLGGIAAIIIYTVVTHYYKRRNFKAL